MLKYSEELITETMQAIKCMDSETLGDYFDTLYLKLNSDYEAYHDVINRATDKLEDNMTEEEIEIQDDKMAQTNSKINRPRSFAEITYLELCDLVRKEVPYEELVNVHLRGIVRN